MVGSPMFEYSIRTWVRNAAAVCPGQNGSATQQAAIRSSIRLASETPTGSSQLDRSPLPGVLPASVRVMRTPQSSRARSNRAPSSLTARCREARQTLPSSTPDCCEKILEGHWSTRSISTSPRPADSRRQSPRSHHSRTGRSPGPGRSRSSRDNSRHCAGTMGRTGRYQVRRLGRKR